MAKQSQKKLGRTKLCQHCHSLITVAFRVRLAQNPDWIFVCKPCCEKAAVLPNYQYGGTWKGLRK